MVLMLARWVPSEKVRMPLPSAVPPFTVRLLVLDKVPAVIVRLPFIIAESVKDHPPLEPLKMASSKMFSVISKPEAVAVKLVSCPEDLEKVP